MPLTKLTKLRIEEVSGVDRPASMLDGFMVMKARDPHALQKAAGLTTADALAIIVDRAAERAVAKATLAELFGTAVPLTEVERLSAALVLKSKHSTRHPFNGKFIAAGTPTPGPDADQYGGAPTNGIPSGTGSPAATSPNPAFPVAWRHGGNSLIG